MYIYIYTCLFTILCVVFSINNNNNIYIFITTTSTSETAIISRPGSEKLVVLLVL